MKNWMKVGIVFLCFVVFCVIWFLSIATFGMEGNGDLGILLRSVR